MCQRNVVINIMQNLVVFIEQTKDDSNISEKAAMLFLNRFCIDEESACELSGVYDLNSKEPLRITLKQKAEGKAILGYLTPGTEMAFLHRNNYNGVKFS